MAIKKHDFVEIEYTGKFKDGIVFDTTDKKTAEENKIYDSQMEYKPGIICVGEEQIPKGLDEFLEGKELDKEYTVELPTAKAFGKKNAQLIKLVPLNVFKKQEVMPQPGLQVNIDNQLATVLRVSGGRVLIDYNHPFSGKDVTYQIKVLRILTDPKEKIEAYLKMSFNLPDIKVEVKENKATITLPIELPPPAQEPIKKKLIELTKVKEIEFKKPEKEAPKKDIKKPENKPETTSQD
ncbi:MAG: peptidylprolyl isomerase [Nanoarchaeota archaeon]|nr:peptidylprolyl isomerase [Nanoarchaeota archaeon]